MAKFISTWRFAMKYNLISKSSQMGETAGIRAVHSGSLEVQVPTQWSMQCSKGEA